MKSKTLILVALVALVLSAGAAVAQNAAAAAQAPVRETLVPPENIKLLWQIPRYIAAPQPKGLAKVGRIPGPLADPLAIYSNVDNATGSAFNNFTPIAADGSFTAIRADDITFTTNPSVGNITSVVVAVYNGSDAEITATVRFRAWLDNGSGAPGTFWNGFSSSATLAIPSGGGAWNFTGLSWAPPNPGGTANLWGGLQFSASFDTDAAELGMFLYDPPGVGSSNDVMFAGDTAATMFGVNNPTGSTFNFGGPPAASAYLEFRVSVLPVELNSFTAE